MVDDDLCGELEPSVNGDSNIVLQEICTVPCPGRRTGRQSASVIGGFLPKGAACVQLHSSHLHNDVM